MKKKKVITIKGNIEHFKDCKSFDGEYYLIGDPTIKGSGDCYLVGDKYYRDNTGYIVYDHYINRYVIKNSSIIEGVIGVLEDKITLIFGYFSKDVRLMPQVVYSEGGKYVKKAFVLDDDILKDSIYVFNSHSSAYVDRRTLYVKDVLNKTPLDSTYKNSLSYNATSEIISTYKNMFSKSEVKGGKLSNSINYYMKNLSFGVEFETIDGVVPTYKSNSLGLIPLRDGSIPGLEYVTIPLQGVEGIQTLLDSADALKRFTTIDESCSLHVHIGNIPRTKSFILALFKVLLFTQDDFYSLFPLYKKYNLGVKRKLYTKEYDLVKFFSRLDMDINVNDSDQLNSNFDVLFRHLCGNDFESYGNDLDNVESHPSDPGGNSKWYIKARYHWVNFIPLIFGNKQTVEFRIHTPTVDRDKISYFMCLLGAVVNYTKENEQYILSKKFKISKLKNIVDSFCVSQSTPEPPLLGEIRDYLFYRTSHYRPIHDSVEINSNEEDLTFNSYINKKELVGNNYYTGKAVKKLLEKPLTDYLTTNIPEEIADITSYSTWHTTVLNSLANSEL